MPRVARRRRIERRVLRCHRLAEEYGAGLAQPAHDRGILAGDALLPQLRAGGGRPIEDIEDILDRDRNAVQRAAVSALAQLARPPLGLGPCAVAVVQYPGPDLGFVAVDLPQAYIE